MLFQMVDRYQQGMLLSINVIVYQLNSSRQW